MILIAFDVDGTLDTSAGPVAWAKVKALEEELGWVNIKVGVVSGSAARPGDGIFYQSSPETRAGNLRKFRDTYPDAKLRIYVSNNGDMDAAKEAGFAYVTEVEFARGLE